MSEKKETYKGRQIIIKTDVKGEQLYIGGKRIDTYLDKASGRYNTSHLPHAEFQSLMDLARNVIDHVPAFKTKPGG